MNGSEKYNEKDCTGTAIGTGKRNTQMLELAMGEKAYSDEKKGFSTTSRYAAKLCGDLSYTVDGVTYDDWFLPSKDELNLLYTVLHKNGLGGFSHGFDDSGYSSSSESDYKANDVWSQDFYEGDDYNEAGKQFDLGRDGTDHVRAIRAF